MLSYGKQRYDKHNYNIEIIFIYENNSEKHILDKYLRRDIFQIGNTFLLYNPYRSGIREKIVLVGYPWFP